MGLVIYFIRGLSLLWFLLFPPYRRKIQARWKVTRYPLVVREVTTGIVGLAIIVGLLVVVVVRLAS